MTTRNELDAIHSVATALEPHGNEARADILKAALALLQGPQQDNTHMKIKEVLIGAVLPIIITRGAAAIDALLSEMKPAAQKTSAEKTDAAEALYQQAAQQSERAENDLKTGASDTAETDGALVGSDPNASH